MLQHTILFDLDTAIQQIGHAAPDHPAPAQLTGVQHDPIRRWADA